jgi:hypothetical protein
MTFFKPILAVLRIPQRSLFDISESYRRDRLKMRGTAGFQRPVAVVATRAKPDRGGVGEVAARKNLFSRSGVENGTIGETTEDRAHEEISGFRGSNALPGID